MRLRLTPWLLLAAACAAGPHPSDLYFGGSDVPDVELVIEPEAMARLQSAPRTYVAATLREAGAAELHDVAVKLKGAAGSFRPVTDRPALTLNVGKFADGRTWRGLKKFHLNNSVQDDSLACESLACKLFTDAGIPTPRAAPARVRLNGRDLGFYVLKEGFDTHFLRRHFGRADGNLYDGGFVQELGPQLERDEGKGPDDKRDLRALVAAIRERNPDKLAGLVDIEKFITLMAMELMMGHWDGYTINRNNYRIYFDPATGKANLFPHGLDQIFQDPNFSILNFPAPMLAAAVMGHPPWRKRYRERLQELLPLFEPARLYAHIDAVAARLKPAMDETRARRHDFRIRNLKARVAARYPVLQQQCTAPDPVMIEFDRAGVAKLAGWRRPAVANVEASETDQWLSIAGKPPGEFAASWRRRALLRRGTYVLEASVRTADVSGVGACVRISGGQPERRLTGTNEPEVLRYQITVAEEWREVEFVLELRGTAGQAWFDRDSVLLRRVN